MKKFLMVVLLGVLLTGCNFGTKSKDTELIVTEQCYDGVVYLEKSGYTNLTVKFNSDGKVATETFDGFKCRT